MKCPYCVEKIQDEARVCRYCGRDLTLVLSLKRENARLREKIAALSALEYQNDGELTVSSDSTRTESGTSGTPPPQRGSRDLDTLSIRQSAGAVLLPAVAVVASYILDQELFFDLATKEERAEATTNVLGLMQWHFTWSDILILSCFISGGWVGKRLAGRHLKTYFFLGTLIALVGAVGLVSYETIRTSGVGSHFGEMGLSFSGPYVILTFFMFDLEQVPARGMYPIDYSLSSINAYDFSIIVIALFISGALFGDLIERVRHPDEAKAGLPERVAGRLTNSPLRKYLSNAMRALPATLLLLTPVWQPIWSQVVETTYAAIKHVWE